MLSLYPNYHPEIKCAQFVKIVCKIYRTPDYKGKGAKIYKSVIRKQLIDEGYRLRGNVGDQWSDLQGDYLADRNFKIPNPMYYVP
jgi:HAD superfamily, subfamily IIIB (Acid phosphatase)